MIAIPHPIRRKRLFVPDALELLKIRRSVKPREMSGPGPTAAELDTILTIGARVPDHGKLTPWRFIVFEGDARARGGDVIAQVFAKKNPAAPTADIEIETRRLHPYRHVDEACRRPPAAGAVRYRDAVLDSARGWMPWSRMRLGLGRDGGPSLPGTQAA